MHERKGIFCRTESVAMTPKSRDHMPTPSLWGRCKMPNSSSEDETDTLPKWPTGIQPYQFEPVRQDFETVPEHRVSFEGGRGCPTQQMNKGSGELTASKPGKLSKMEELVQNEECRFCFEVVQVECVRVLECDWMGKDAKFKWNVWQCLQLCRSLAVEGGT